jgi:purine-binding chemotaxis protein CheW
MSNSATIDRPGVAGASTGGALGGKYLTFSLGDETYGFEILKVREIIGLMHITPVPHTPPYVRGVVNLRGQVIPVVDLRTKFGMETVTSTDETCIIVVDIDYGGRKCNTGIIVDRVCEVLNISSENVEPPPTFDPSVSTEFILGMGKVGQSVKILLNIDLILRTAEVAKLAELQETPAQEGE